jgi:Holliday junction resolvase-like predicted endonuclease
MGRNKKTITIDRDKFSSMEKSEKLTLFSDFQQLFYYELSNIPYYEIETNQKDKAELIAEKYFKEKGYEVYRSKVNGGYRCIGVEFYWQSFVSKITEEDKRLIARLKTLMPPLEFKELAYMVREKNGTPDLLLIKDNRISFVEVKFNYETVKHSTVEFYIRYGERWPMSILRVIVK